MDTEERRQGYTRRDLWWIIPLSALGLTVIALAIAFMWNYDPVAYGH